MWKCNPFGWLWGLPLLALLWLPVYFEHGNIEDDLEERTAVTMEDAGFDWARIDFSGRDGILRGAAPSESERQEAIKLAESVSGTRVVSDQTDIARHVSPYKWSAEKDGSKVILDGYAPGRAERKKIVEMARQAFPAGQIVDNMEIAQGAPDRTSFMDSVKFGLNQLALFNYGRVWLRDDKFNIEGLTLDQAGYDRLSRALRNELPMDMRLATNRVKAPEKIIPLASPYKWQAVRDGNQLKLTGHVHSQDEKSEIIENARRLMPDAEIVDHMQIARGKPTSRQWRKATGFALDQLARLENGSVTLSDFDFSISGHAANVEDYGDVTSAIAKLPRGFSMARKELTVPKIDPYIWRADYHAGRLTLSGHVPDRAAKLAIKSKARRHFPRAYIIDKMETGPGAPDEWSKAASLSLAELARLEDGSAMIWNNEIEMRGKAKDDQQRSSIREAMQRKLPSSYQFYEEIRVPKPATQPEEEDLVPAPKVSQYPEDELDSNSSLGRDVCQSYLDSVLAANSIHFATASARLSEESFPVLTRLAHIANRCPDTRIEIAGHTDSDGSRKFNEFLSLRRARAVVKYLISKGVSKDRLSAIGYGEARPIAPNNSPENKARNRRIEFVVKEF